MSVIEKDFSSYVIFSEETLLTALQKIGQNKAGFVFAVRESGVVEGVLTDGDFRRWIMKASQFDLSVPVSRVVNRDFRWLPDTSTPDQIRERFNERVEVIPLLDSSGRLTAIAFNRPHEMRIGEHVISDSAPCFVIAEIGNNHNGDFELAKRLVDEAVRAGADCAKFQLRDLSSLYANKGNANDAAEDLGSQYTLDLLSRFQLSNDDMLRIFDYCVSKKIQPLCTPWDEASLRILEKWGMPGFKVASADLTNHDFLRILARTGKPLICSTGMSTSREIAESVQLLNRESAQFVLLHCNSTYPAPFKDINLRHMHDLKEAHNCVVGYSGHERGVHVAVAAVAMGAKVIEKHFTLDRGMEGNDHKVSLLPDEFKEMVAGIRSVEEALGETGTERRLTQGELMNREVLAKSLVINCDLKSGDVITSEMIEVRSPGKGLAPYRKRDLVGRVARRNFKNGDFFFQSDLEEGGVALRPFKFRRPWGVPVRYHDLGKIMDLTNLDLVEFHFSYKDLDEDVSKHLSGTYPIDFVVHAPELFTGDHLLDLSSDDESYRRRSIEELQRVIDITVALKQYFPKTKRPPIIINAGGFTKSGFLPAAERQALYDRIADSLSYLKTDGVEIIPQTMPPFPWHFGGQQYHNLFMDPHEIKAFCDRHGMRVCFDISHSKLACNHFKWSFHEFVKMVGPYTAHLHVVDAKGVDGEGLQIGDGDLDFSALGEDLDRFAPEVSFIPEIWQGHKNNGEGFWVALDRLEKWF